MWAQGVSVREQLGLLGVLCQQALRVVTGVGVGRHGFDFCGVPGARSFLLAFCPPPWHWEVVSPLEQGLPLQMVKDLGWIPSSAHE